MNRIEYFKKLAEHDWYYAMSDDQSVWRKGEAAKAELVREAQQNEELQPMLDAFKKAHGEAMANSGKTEWPTFHSLTGNHLAILIDPTEATIEHVEYDGDYKSIYKLIGASCFDVVRIDNNDCIFVDDEGLINGKGEEAGFFIFGNYQSPLAGKGLVLGTDHEGESVSCKNSLFFLEENIKWVMRISNGVITAMPHNTLKQLRQAG